MKLSFGVIFSIVMFLLVSCKDAHEKICKSKIINFSHLEHLTETIKLNDKQVDIVHIYADYPDYKWMDASSEGVSCVDDVARAAVVYLTYFELFDDESILEKSKRLLRFVMALQAEDGNFYNFIFPNGKKNKKAEPTKKLFNFWAARQIWTPAKGYRV